ncbi:MAG: YggS family pyridoxal phosphate-dependent enzyme [Prevotellaceae bacterium]|jgi:pyridoxal phosphate enzyme (YggS family)|nr:YggS family pyridoxal phosphate-dependent enzyme [Prevotellaceae bacterium]
MIKENLAKLRERIPENIELVCVSKFHPNKAILEAYNCGERIFGESKVQELLQKYETLPNDISWHFIGHLQRNKVKYIIPFVELIHGVDSERLLSEINKEAAKINRTVSCLLQVHIADEETKFGFDLDKLYQTLCSVSNSNYKNISIRGVMGMATLTQDLEQIRLEFRYLKKIFDDLKTKYFSDNPNFSEISMGMSDDYRIAIEEGSTMLRIGSTIFGRRDY